MEEKLINILLVEDDEVDVMNVKRAFKKNKISHPLFVASNGLEALAMLRAETGQEPKIPDSRRLILLDLNMPKMSGIEFLRELRADLALRMTPVIVLTTSNQDRDRVEAYQLNVAGYMLKPVSFTNFADTISTLNKYWMLCELP